MDSSTTTGQAVSACYGDARAASTIHGSSWRARRRINGHAAVWAELGVQDSLFAGAVHKTFTNVRIEREVDSADADVATVGLRPGLARRV